MKTLVIIGAGPGGYECAVRAAKAGLDVHIIDRREHLGGTCLNEGCIPTKCLCHTAELLHDVHQAESLGLQTPIGRFDLGLAVARKDEVVGKLQGGIEALLRTSGITFHNGFARFAPGNPHTVLVDETSFKADAVIIATGSASRSLQIPGVNAPGVVSSSEMLYLQEVPNRLCIIGGGVIGMEFASIFSTFGAEVTVVEYMKEILPGFDKDISKRLRTTLKRSGIRFVTGAPVTEIRTDESGTLHVDYTLKEKVDTIDADLVLMAVGRRPRLETLNLEEAGIAFTPRGITVDDRMRTSIDGIYAVGDVNGRCQLAHVATFQSYRALADILGESDATDLSIIPAAVFTTPECAMVGLTEEAAKEQYPDCEVHKAFYRTNGRALAIEASSDGLVKIITKGDGEIIGAHILGTSAAELIHEIALLMNLHGTLGQLRHMIHAHPSLSELWLAAAE